MTEEVSPGELGALGRFALRGRTVVVTGASAGIGARAARVLHSAGAQVVVAARRRDRLDALVATLPGSLAVRCDVTVPEDLDALVDAATDAFGGIDVVVNNAGIGDEPPALDEDDTTFAAVVAVNLTAPFALSTRVARRWVAAGRGGVVINIGSVLGQVASASVPSAGYAAAKAGLHGLTRDLAAQWGRHGIRVNTLAPGFVPSEMTAGIFASDAGRRMLGRRTLLPRLGEPTDLDGALLFLASDASAFVTGQVLAVDGGWTAT
ncbi:SDR family oxidoreductase [Nitriliruptoraceae bacterium ZYF776]|nr:SDR family oxidoreductase [Profundirhabdus halotolerans]